MASQVCDGSASILRRTSRCYSFWLAVARGDSKIRGVKNLPLFLGTPQNWTELFMGQSSWKKQKLRQVKNSIEREVRLHKYTPFNHSMVSFKSPKYDWIGMRMDGFWSEGSFSEAEDWRFLLSSWPGSQMHNIHWKALRCYMSPTQHETHSFVCWPLAIDLDLNPGYPSTSPTLYSRNLGRNWRISRTN